MLTHGFKGTRGVTVCHLPLETPVAHTPHTLEM